MLPEICSLVHLFYYSHPSKQVFTSISLFCLWPQVSWIFCNRPQFFQIDIAIFLDLLYFCDVTHVRLTTYTLISKLPRSTNSHVPLLVRLYDKLSMHNLNGIWLCSSLKTYSCEYEKSCFHIVPWCWHCRWEGAKYFSVMGENSSVLNWEDVELHYHRNNKPVLFGGYLLSDTWILSL